MFSNSSLTLVQIVYNVPNLLNLGAHSNIVIGVFYICKWKAMQNFIVDNCFTKHVENGIFVILISFDNIYNSMI